MTTHEVARPAVATAGHEGQFATGDLMVGLKGRTVSRGIVSGVAQITTTLLSLGSIVVLARLVTPQDFGLVAMVATVIGFFRPFSDAGLSAATIQRDDITNAQVSNLFWMNVGLGIAITLGLIAAAPAIAWFYEEPRLIMITVWSSSAFVLSGATVQHMALLNRHMQFRTIATVQVTAAAVGALVGIAMALLGFGYWSLVGIGISTPLATLCHTWSISRWRPAPPSRPGATGSLLSFGANLTASRFLWSLARGSDGLLIGRFFGAEALGLYSRGMVLLTRPLEQAMAPLEAVFVPTFSRLQADPERYRRVALQVFDVIALAGFLFSGFLLVLARPLTLIVLGPQWEEAAPIFAAFTLVAVYVPLTSAAGWLLTSQGRGRDFLTLSSIASVVTVVCFLIGLRFGLVGVALSYSLSCLFVHLPVAFHIVGRKGVVTSRDLWKRFLEQFPVWIVVCSTMSVVKGLVADEHVWTQLFVCALAGLVAGVVFISLYPPSRRIAANVIAAGRERKMTS